MTSQWFIMKKGNQMGPYTSKQIKQQVSIGFLQPEDLIWKKGMSKWFLASASKKLFNKENVFKHIEPLIINPNKKPKSNSLFFAKNIINNVATFSMKCFSTMRSNINWCLYFY